MAAYRSPVGGVTADDVLQSSRKIVSESTEAYDEPFDSRNIGSRFNQWRKPVAEFGSNTSEWEVKLKSSPYVGDMKFAEKEWSRARASVDGVLDLLLKEVQAISSIYEGLKIEGYVRQGSAREGLKVIAPDEFDTILQFNFEGLSFEHVELRKNGKIVPDFCYLEVKQSMDVLQSRFPTLCKEGTFYQDGAKVRINARMMHQGVFESIIDKARDNVMRKVYESMTEGSEVFRLTRKINPPSINITIHLNDRAIEPQGSIENPQTTMKAIDLDIVPGLVIRNDQVPDPSNRDQTMDCPVYAVFKWVEESSMKASDFPNPNIVWRISSSGIEKHTLDLVRSDEKQKYIITAMRVLKTYFVKTKRESSTPPPIATVLKSYHLKHIAFYLILYTCYIHKDAKIYGIGGALRYFLALLRESLEKKSLPHFFHSNVHVSKMYPTYQPRTDQLQFNLLGNKSEEALNEARLSMDYHLLPGLGFSPKGVDDVGEKLYTIKQEYSRGISMGTFF